MLDKISALHILPEVYEHILTTPEVVAEFQKSLPDWIEVIPVKNIQLKADYSLKVDAGEASAIALAQEIPNALLIVDDFKGRKLADELNIKFTGTIGVLIAAKQKNKIPLLKPYFDKVKSTNFRIDPLLLQKILDELEA